jgi:hypothetical protein
MKRRLIWLPFSIPLALVTAGIGPCDPEPLGGVGRDAGQPGTGGESGTGGAPGTGGVRGSGGRPDPGGTGGALVLDGGGSPDGGDICALPIVQGPCAAYFHRYGYNPATQQCEFFAYGGCFGNENNFETPGACFDRCVPPGFCDFATSYEFGLDGGLAIQPYSYLLPGRAYRHVVRDLQSGVMECDTTLPDCRTPGLIDADDILRDLADYDVHWALDVAAPPLLYGVDNRPVDGAVFVFDRAGGGSFTVGDPCNGQPGCQDAPAGIQRLVADLKQLDKEQAMTAACAPLGGH